MNALMYIGSFVIALGILVAVHEFGHFWVAKKLGVKVLRFSIGFGKVIWSRKSGETEYVLSAIPLGGYVKMLDEREGDVPEEEKHRAFNNKPVLTRIAIIVAGPGFNFLFAIFALWIMFLNGIPGLRAVVGDVQSASLAQQAGFQQGDHITAVNGKQATTWEAVRLALFDAALDRKPIEIRVQGSNDNVRTLQMQPYTKGDPVEAKDLIKTYGFIRWSPPAVLGDVVSGGPADKAGLKKGDRILTVQGKPMQSWIAWVTEVRKRPGQDVTVTYQRNGQVHSARLKTDIIKTKQGEIGRVGVSMPEDYWDKLYHIQEYSFGGALTASMAKTWDMSVLMLRVLSRIVVGEASLRNISGPITIAQYAGDSASLGWLPFLSFLAIVSISLGVLNLLPIPVLDGGHLLFYLVELVKGSPVSEQVQATAQRAGILLLLAVMALAFYNDLARLLG